MSDRNDHNLDPQQQTARDAVGSLPRAGADAAFRARLKADFVSGDIAAKDKVVDLPRRRPARWLSAGLAMAAVLALAVIGLNRLPGPELLAVTGQGDVIIDGERHPAGATAELAALLRPGAHVVVEGGATVDLVYPGTMLWRLEGGTEMVLPDRPGRWFARRTRAHVEIGEAALRTGPDLAGGAVAVRTPDGQILITGTLVNIFRNEELSCFCLWEGSASVQTFRTDLGAIPPNMRWVVFADREKEAQKLDIAPPHRDHMLAMDAEYPDIFAH